MTAAFPVKWFSLKVETDLPSERTRCDIVCPAEGRKEVVKRIFVGQINRRQARAQFVLVAVEQVVMADRDIEEIPRRDARRIVVVVFGSGRGYL